MKLTETIIAWNSKPGCLLGTGTEMKLFSFPIPPTCDDSGFNGTAGAGNTHIHDLSEKEKTLFLLATAMKLIIGFGMDSQIVHNTLCEIREYRNGLMSGTTPVPDHLKEKFRKE